MKKKLKLEHDLKDAINKLLLKYAGKTGYFPVDIEITCGYECVVAVEVVGERQK